MYSGKIAVPPGGGGLRCNNNNNNNNNNLIHMNLAVKFNLLKDTQPHYIYNYIIRKLFRK
jgi:hypothetical protein